MSNPKNYDDGLESKHVQEKKTKHHVAVIVLGDVGRSPRMQYHALSLLQNQCQVTLIGYEGEDLIPDLMSIQNQQQQQHFNIFHTIRFNPNNKLSILSSNKISLIILKLPVIGKLWYYMLRLSSLIYGVYDALWNQMKSVPDCILIQNPPSIPLLLLSLIYCHSNCKLSIQNRYRNDNGNEDGLNNTQQGRPGLVIDWHNLGFTMFGYNSSYHPIKWIAKYYEKQLGPKADAHLCVTRAMKEYLIHEHFVTSSTDDNNSTADISKLIDPKSTPKTNSNAKINVLHDRPPDFFHKCNAKEIHQVMYRYRDHFIDCFANDSTTATTKDECISRVVEDTLFTMKCLRSSSYSKNANENVVDDNIYEYLLKKDRPALLVSSTSWTPDEDFSILLDALIQTDKMIQSKNDDFPKLVVAVTGKGPQKEYYQKRIKSLNPTLSYISIQTLWLSSSDYPLFIGSADLGISLHTSTSGIDLPMKVLDMMGCHVPVCAIAFKCVGELVVDDVNGKVFENESQLANILLTVFGTKGNNFENGHWRDGEGILGQWREGIGSMKRWKENWNTEAKELIFEACHLVEKNVKKDYLWFYIFGALMILIFSSIYPYFF